MTLPDLYAARIESFWQCLRISSGLPNPMGSNHSHFWQLSRSNAWPKVNRMYRTICRWLPSMAKCNRVLPLCFVLIVSTLMDSLCLVMNCFSFSFLPWWQYLNMSSSSICERTCVVCIQSMRPRKISKDPPHSQVFDSHHSNTLWTIRKDQF